MLERPEAAAVAFATGIIVVIVGLIGVSASTAVNIGFIIVGVLIGVLSVAWWQMLKRSNRELRRLTEIVATW